MAQQFTFDPRLSLIDLYEQHELHKAEAREAVRKMPTPEMKALEDEIALRKKEGRL
jgi:hypothetical protein